LDNGLFSAIPRVLPNLLTVLNYHRIVDYTGEGFDAFKPVVSATPANFELQMEYVSRLYNVISIEDLALWIRGKKAPPPNAAVITFDDGYYDNYENAYPILKKYGFPSVIFLATDYMGKATPFYWDYAAYCFSHTSKDRVRFPSGLYLSWGSSIDRDEILAMWVQEVKYLLPDDKQRAIAELEVDLNIAVPSDIFKGLFLTWDKIHELSEAGIEFGAHTASHPINENFPSST